MARPGRSQHCASCEQLLVVSLAIGVHQLVRHASNHPSCSSLTLPSLALCSRSCWWTSGPNKGNRSLFDQLPRCGIATFHTSCAISASLKKEAMLRMLDKTRTCQQGIDDGGQLGPWGPRTPPWELANKHANAKKNGRGQASLGGRGGGGRGIARSGGGGDRSGDRPSQCHSGPSRRHK